MVPNMMVHACDISTQKAEAREFGYKIRPVGERFGRGWDRKSQIDILENVREDKFQ